MPEVTCSLLPQKMRELQAEWASSGSIAAYDFGAGGSVTASYTSDVTLTNASIVARPDALSLDYKTGFAFGPIENGNTASGSIARAWRIQNLYNESSFTGSVVLSRENDAGNNWDTGSVLFEYSGSRIEEIDLTFDQSGRPVVTGDRRFIVADISQSQVWLYRFSTVASAFIFTGIATGSTPRIMLDDPIDVSNSDVLLFYVRGYTSEDRFGSWGIGQFIAATGSGVSGDFSSSYQTGSVTLSLSPYHFSSESLNEIGVFTSQTGRDPSIGITGSFNFPGVASLGVTIVGPDAAGNQLFAYNTAGGLIDQRSFLYDSNANVLTKDTQVIHATSGSYIRTFRLAPATNDYVGYDMILFEPTSGSTEGNFSTQQVYYRQQRDNYAIEYVVPLIEDTFLEWVDWMFGSFTGTIGGGDEPGVLIGEVVWESWVSGTIIGTWSGSFTGSSLIYHTGSGISGSSSESMCDNNINIEIHQYHLSSGSGEQGIFSSRPTVSASVQMTISFSDPYVHRVGMRCINANYANDLIGFDSSGNEVDRATFPYVFGQTTGPWTEAYITASGVAGTGSSPIVRVVVDPDPLDYIAFDSLLYSPILPTSDFIGESGSFQGILTGSVSGNVLGFASGAMTGTFSGSRGFNDGILTGSTSSSLIEGELFIYDLFLEDVTKLRDNRLSLYVSRRNIDSGSGDIGEYRVQKLETILYPQKVVEDEYTASVTYLTSSLLPIIAHTVYDIDSYVSASMMLESGSLRQFILTHSVYDKDSYVSSSMTLESGSLRQFILTHSVYDKDSYVSSSMVLSSGSMRQIVITHTVYDKDSYVSSSVNLLSGSLE